MGARVFRHGELPLVVLALLAEQPMHGYELLGRISTVFESYSASPGAVYPAVSALQEQGLLRGIDKGRRTVYEVTDAGAAALAARQSVLAELEQRLGVEITPRPLDREITQLAERLRELAPVVGANAMRRFVEQMSVKLEKLGERHG